MNWNKQRRFVRSHIQTIRLEGYIWIGLQGFFALVLMLALYVKFKIEWISGLAITTSIVLFTLSGFVRSGFFLQPKLSIFVRKIISRPRHYSRAASAFFVTTTSAFVIIAFIFGLMRASLLRDQDPQMTVTESFTGMANVLASADGALLLFERQGDAFRYIYSSADFATSVVGTAAVESPNPNFSPIGRSKVSH